MLYFNYCFFAVSDNEHVVKTYRAKKIESLIYTFAYVSDAVGIRTNRYKLASAISVYGKKFTIGKSKSKSSPKSGNVDLKRKSLLKKKMYLIFQYGKMLKN